MTFKIKKQSLHFILIGVLIGCIFGYAFSWLNAAQSIAQMNQSTYNSTAAPRFQLICSPQQNISYYVNCSKNGGNATLFKTAERAEIVTAAEVASNEPVYYSVPNCYMKGELNMLISYDNANTPVEVGLNYSMNITKRALNTTKNVTNIPTTLWRTCNSTVEVR
jgi:hypothetical protein